MRSNPLLILPGSCYPQPDELLSSWVSRLALNHGMAPLVFWRSFYQMAKFECPQKHHFHIDLDRYQLPEVWDLLATRTKTPLERVYDTTLWDYTLFTKDPLSNARSLRYTWWLPFGRKFATVIGPSFCASCLQKDGTHPYFRKSWRFSHTVACLDCGVLLANGCPRCRSSIDYRKLTVKGSIDASLTDLALNLATCRSCGYDLAQTPLQPAAPAVLALQQRLHQIWRESLTAGRRKMELSFSYLELIIETLVAFNEFQLRGDAPACFLILGSRYERPLSEYNNLSFDNLSADLRARLLYQAMEFLGEGWDEFRLAYLQYASKYTPMYFSQESPMFGVLNFKLKSMSPDWMANWSAFAPDVRDS